MGRRYKSPTIDWPYAWEETYNILPRSWRFILLYEKWSHVWHIGVGENLFHHQVLPDDIDDIQDPEYHIRRRTFFWPVRRFAEAWMTLRARNPFPSGLATLNPQSTCTDLGQGPNLCAGSGPAPYVPRSREYEERPAAGREKNAEGPKKYNYICVYIVSLHKGLTL